MLVEQRLENIRQLIQKDGVVHSAFLAEHLQVSDETVRRDLLTLEKEGTVRRVHGGAVATAEKMKSFYGLPRRDQDAIPEKQALAQKAAEFVQDGDIIAIGGGSTAKFFAEALKNRGAALTVVTYSLDVFETLHGQEQIDVILCGGHFHEEERAFYGTVASLVLDNLHTQKCFEFPSAVSLEHGIGDYQPDIHPLQKQMLSHASQVFILADSSKFEKRALLKIDDMRPDYRYVTDSRLPESIRTVYTENNRQIFIGEVQ